MQFTSVTVTRTFALPDAVEQRSLTTLREKLIKIEARAHHWSVLPNGVREPRNRRVEISF